MAILLPFSFKAYLKHTVTVYLFIVGLWTVGALSSFLKIPELLNKEFQEIHKGIQYVDYEEKYGSKCYAIYVLSAMNFDSSETYFPRVESGGYSAYALAYDLGKLEHLKQYGVDLTRLQK